MAKVVKDAWGQEILDGDFVISASKSEGAIVMGVMANVEKQTRVRVDQNWRTKKWEAADRPHRMYTLERTLKVTDEMILDKNPELFEVMVQVRHNLSLPTNNELKARQKQLKKMLEDMFT